jgi:hypothetical protein
MKFVSGRTVAILVAVMVPAMVATTGVAQANDVGVVRAVGKAARGITTPKVKKALKHIDSAIKAHNPRAVLAPVAVFIAASEKAVKRVTPVHGASGKGKKLKKLALAGFKDFHTAGVDLQESANDYIAGNRSESNTLANDYAKDFVAGNNKLNQAAKVEAALISGGSGGGGGGGISPIS